MIDVKKYILNMLWLLFIPATFILIYLADNNPAIVESVFSASVFPAAAKILPFQYLPYFSVFELLLFGGPVVLVIFFVRFLIRLVRVKENRLQRVLRLVQRVLIVLAVGLFLFNFLWGFNYYRQPYSKIAGLPVQPSTSDELYALCEDLVRDTNAARSKLQSNDDGTLLTRPAISELNAMARRAYDKAFEDGVAGVIGVKCYAKPLLSSYLFSYMGIAGVYFPYTAEPNFNNHVKEPARGSIICHEIAHRQGFAREDEADFLAYAVCVNSDEPYLNYAGYFMALNHAMGRLYSENRDAYSMLKQTYSREVLADIEAKQEYWRMFEGPLEERITNINDSYLKAQSQEDGVKSYSRMIDLMLAQKRLAG